MKKTALIIGGLALAGFAFVRSKVNVARNISLSVGGASGWRVADGLLSWTQYINCLSGETETATISGITSDILISDTKVGTAVLKSATQISQGQTQIPLLVTIPIENVSGILFQIPGIITANVKFRFVGKMTAYGFDFPFDETKNIGFN